MQVRETLIVNELEMAFNSDLLFRAETHGGDWTRLLQQEDRFGPPVVALGKFDALHRGHQKLAIKAVHLGGTPYLISFTGMADILGWEPRLPLVAPVDRTRVLELWKDLCLGAVPREHRIPFGSIRNLSPEEFVALLAVNLGVKGVVVGSNYRFGYRAAGTARTLKTLGAVYGMKVDIVNLLENNEGIQNGLGDVVSSSKIREALKKGDMSLVEQCMGRGYRLIALTDAQKLKESKIVEYSSCMNQYPMFGEYKLKLWIVHDVAEAHGDGFQTLVAFTESGIDLGGISVLDDLHGPVYCVFQF